MYFPRKNGHVILGFFGVLSEESGDSVPRTPWDFSLWACSGRDRPWAGGLPGGGRTRLFARLHRRSRCVLSRALSSVATSTSGAASISLSITRLNSVSYCRGLICQRVV